MKKLFLLVIVLFLSFQQVTLAAIGEAANTPDSVFLFSYVTSRDDGRSGLRFAWSMDQKHWFAVGQGTGKSPIIIQRHIKKQANKNKLYAFPVLCIIFQS